MIKKKKQKNLAPVDDSLDGCDVGLIDKNVLIIQFNLNYFHQGEI